MSKHILVIGAGVIGLSTAYYAIQKGHRVTILDRGGPDHDCCSLGNAGYVCPSHFIPLAAPGMVAMGLKYMRNPKSPFYIKPRLDLDLLSWGLKFWRSCNAGHVQLSGPLLRDLQLACRQCFIEMAESCGNEFGLAQKGILNLCRTEAGMDHERHFADAARQLKVPVEVLTAAETARLEPAVNMDIVGSIYFPMDCHLAPHRFMAWLQRHLTQSGVKFQWNSQVVGWTKSTGRVEGVRTSTGDCSADE